MPYYNRQILLSREGGHNIPEDVVHRRFYSGWRNFKHIYRDIVDEWTLYDASGHFPVVVEEGGN